MEYILLFFLVLVVGTFGYLCFKIIKWIFNKRVRGVWILSLISFVVIAVLINKVFFEKMEFIQSKVYPNLFLVKHPIKDRDSINKRIKIKVIEEIEKLQLGRKNVFEIPNRNTVETIRDNDKTIHFYQYTTAWGFDNGTVHFIENKEDPGGFSSEVLNNYYEYKMAYFQLEYCRNDSTKTYGILRYYKNSREVKTISILNNCEETKDTDSDNNAESISDTQVEVVKDTPYKNIK